MMVARGLKLGWRPKRLAMALVRPSMIVVKRGAEPGAKARMGGERGVWIMGGIVIENNN